MTSVPTSSGNPYVDSIRQLAFDLKEAGISRLNACIRVAGSHVDGVVLEHIFFRSLPGKDGKPQFMGDYQYVAVRKLAVEKMLDRRTIMRAIARLKAKGAIGHEHRHQNHCGTRGHYCYAWLKPESFYALVPRMRIAQGPGDSVTPGLVTPSHHKAASPFLLPHSEDPNPRALAGIRELAGPVPQPMPATRTLSLSSSRLSPVAPPEIELINRSNRATGLGLEEMKATFEEEAEIHWPGQDHGTHTMQDGLQKTLLLMAECGLSGIEGFKAICVGALTMHKLIGTRRVHPGLLHYRTGGVRNIVRAARERFGSADVTSIRLLLRGKRHRLEPPKIQSVFTSREIRTMSREQYDDYLRSRHANAS